MDLHQVVERFLTHVQRARSEKIHKRYSHAMELLLSYLAVELLDPEVDDKDQKRGPAGRIEELTEDVLRRYTSQFLMEQLGGDPRVLKRNLLATHAFIKYLTSEETLDQKKGEKLSAIVRSSLKSLDRGRTSDVMMSDVMTAEGEQVHLFKILLSDPPYVDIENLVTEEVMEHVLLSNQDEYTVQEHDICMMTISPDDGGFRARCRGVLDSAVDLSDGSLLEDYASDAYYDINEDELDGDDVDEDGDDEDEDEDPQFGEPMLSPEDAMEILAVEDRYAPRSVIQAILEGYDEVRDELMEWVTGNDYRDTPFPGAGEAPANAARILSEMSEIEIADRLTQVLGDSDPLGEEAPLALARLGPDVLNKVEKVAMSMDGPLERISAGIWSLGFLAARNPACRAQVIDRLCDLAIKGSPATSDTLQVLSEMRATEGMRRLRDAFSSGSLDLEKHGFTEELLEHQVYSPGWGQNIAEALVPVAFLYPTEEELEDLYSTLEEDMVDWDPLDDEVPGPESDDMDEEKEPFDVSKEPATSSEQGKVIPFTLNHDKREKE